MVSTHSRLKAAVCASALRLSITASFNTQPPEGGWIRNPESGGANKRFNTQPPEGGWADGIRVVVVDVLVSTHSRLKAAGLNIAGVCNYNPVSTHSRLKAAGAEYAITCKATIGFNTQPPEGGWKADSKTWIGMGVSTHSRLKAAGNLMDSLAAP